MNYADKKDSSGKKDSSVARLPRNDNQRHVIPNLKGEESN